MLDKIRRKKNVCVFRISWWFIARASAVIARLPKDLFDTYEPHCEEAGYDV